MRMPSDVYPACLVSEAPSDVYPRPVIKMEM